MKDFRPVLLIEDNPTDAKIIKQAYASLKIRNKLIHVTNSEEALSYLRNNRNKKPCVIILDLNLPKTDGVNFLHAVKHDKNLKQMPVVILTTSSQEQDVAKGFELGVAGYILKPSSYEEYVEKLQTIQLYWSLSELPV